MDRPAGRHAGTVAALHGAALHRGEDTRLGPDAAECELLSALHRRFPSSGHVIRLVLRCGRGLSQRSRTRCLSLRRRELQALVPKSSAAQCPSLRQGSQLHRPGNRPWVAALNRAAIHRGEPRCGTVMIHPSVAALQGAVLHRGSAIPRVWGWRTSASQCPTALPFMKARRGLPSARTTQTSLRSAALPFIEAPQTPVSQRPDAGRSSPQRCPSSRLRGAGGRGLAHDRASQRSTALPFIEATCRRCVRAARTRHVLH